MKIAARKRPSIRVRGRSFMALVLSPVAPIEEWLAELDVQTQRAASFFQGRYVILDLSLLPREDPGISGLVEEFRGRGVRLIGIEGADPSWEMAVWQMPPAVGFLPDGAADAASPPDEPVATADVAPEIAPDVAPDTTPATTDDAPRPVLLPAGAAADGNGAPSLLVDRPVRSGQTISFAQGDVIVVGAVSSGAEIFAGGSIHIYGTLRGRAIAGMSGETAGGSRRAGARIFCRKLDAELLVIGGVYRTADDLDPALRGRAVQAWVEGDEMIVAALD